MWGTKTKGYVKNADNLKESKWPIVMKRALAKLNGQSDVRTGTVAVTSEHVEMLSGSEESDTEPAADDSPSQVRTLA